MRKLYRSRRDKKVTGLCGGLAELLNVDATLLRLLVIIAAFFSGGTVIFIYIIASLVIPKEPGFDGPFYHGHSAGFGPGQSYGGGHGYGSWFGGAAAEEKKNNIDEAMKDIERRAMQREIEQLKAKIADYEKKQH